MTPRVFVTTSLFGVITEIFACYPVMSFGLEIGRFTDFALGHFQARTEWIARARSFGITEWEDDAG